MPQSGRHARRETAVMHATGSHATSHALCAEMHTARLALPTAACRCRNNRCPMGAFNDIEARKDAGGFAARDALQSARCSP